MHSWGWLDWQILSLGKHLTGNFTKSLSFSVFKVLIYQNVEKRSLLTYWKLSKITQLLFLVFRHPRSYFAQMNLRPMSYWKICKHSLVCVTSSILTALIMLSFHVFARLYCFQTMMPITKTVCCRSNLTNNHYAWCHD